MTYIVALTGGISSGKTTVSNSFKKTGVNIIDTDIIAKNTIKYNYKISDLIKKKFGKKIVNPDNSINRFILRKYIFYNKNCRLWLENLLYPEIFQETKNQIKLVKSIWCLWVVPLLIEKKLEKQAHRILLVDLPVKYQIKRLIQRDKIGFQEAKKIISLQATRKERLSKSDDIIYNIKSIKKINQYIYFLNKFYSYLGDQYCQKKNVKKNYLTKFY